MKNAKLILIMMSIFMSLTLPLESVVAAGVFDFLKGGEEGAKAAEAQPDHLDVVTGSARAEINAIANLLLPGSGLMAIDLSHKTNQFCMLDGVSQRNMIHFSHTPGNTTEDVLYFLNPETFLANGLNAKKLPALPSELGKMVPHQWYYYDGTYTEPHHGRTLGVDFLVMAIDVK